MTALRAKAPTKVVTGECRFSFAHLFRPHAFEGQEPAYGVMLLIPKGDHETVKKIKGAFETAASDFWGDKRPSNVRVPLRDGDEEYQSKGDYFKGHWFMNVKSREKPGVVDKNRQDIIEPSEIYSGCYGRVSISAFAYDKLGNRGVSFGLNNVQKLRDGESLTGRTRAQDDFADEFSSNDNEYSF